jgi:16S rRNA A1518/A1519 N6-dimethyltransferase RsmA/KsgA/DIM1 with predicted DNA glycosylase/AP lyase activity
MSYYNKNYYPTPQSVINIMLDGLDLHGKTVLDPSAGMGALLDAVKYRAEKTYAIEIEPEFASVLKDKKHNFLNTDFLTFSGNHRFDFIIMNPPFDNGAKHCLKAIEILPDGSTLVCLLNSETVNNPYTSDREMLLNIINHYNGEIVELGDVFKDAERKTNVNVSMVKLTKPTVKTNTLNFDEMKNNGSKTTDFSFSNSETQLERHDKITAYCRAYNSAIGQLKELFGVMENMKVLTSPFVGKFEFRDMMKELVKELADGASYNSIHNKFVLDLQTKAWDKIFSDSKITQLMTQKVRDDFDMKRREMGGYDLNPENIMTAFAAIFEQRETIQTNSIQEAFDWLTAYSEKNRSYFGETWKTNSHYMIGKKVIINVMSGYGSFAYSVDGKLNDLDRVMCLLSGKKYDNIVRLSDTIRDCFSWSGINTNQCSTTFFDVTLYKKGSAHLVFKDDDLRMLLNRTACSAKGWQLPEAETFKGKSKRK